MSSAPTHSLDGRLYRAALLLCPPGFRQDHGDEMARDFDEARQEAQADGDRALWFLRCLMAVDLARTLTVQWIRTGIPVIALVSTLVPLVIAEGLATLARRTTVRIPRGLEDEEVVTVLFVAVIVVVLIAMTILVSQWVGRLTRPRRR
jgi:hypothetical protein